MHFALLDAFEVERRQCFYEPIPVAVNELPQAAQVLSLAEENLCNKGRPGSVSVRYLHAYTPSG